MLYTTIGAGNVAVGLFERKHIVCRFNFSRIYWKGVDRAMSMYPQMFRIWTTKHISGCCGVNRRLSKIDDSVANTCPCCGRDDEPTTHLTRCPDPGRQLAFSQSVTTLSSWMEETHVDADMITCLRTYLRSAGKGSMVEIAKGYPHLHEWANEQDILGWDNLLEGRIGSTMMAIQRERLLSAGSRLHIDTWAGKLVSHLLSITHNQWIYRNTKLHLRLVEGKTMVEHDNVMNEVLSLLATDPDDI
jgi:hypothetical protein